LAVIDLPLITELHFVLRRDDSGRRQPSLVPYARKVLSDAATLMAVPWSLVGVGLVVALLVALISAAVPAWRAGRMQIADALVAR
jgi:ABC-type antimicrobial peptide transport system permease subunit